MPLPSSAPLSLQVSSNAVQSKPKRAMIVRMSAETLDALEAFPNHPPLSFDFGDVPGIYIRDTFFPMRPQKESSPHELYLRAASSLKPMAPLKLYANVVGKFMVERQLGDRVTGKVRQQTMVAKQQHMERQAILLDQPPIPVSAKNGKRKMPGSGTVLKKTLPSDQLRLASRKVSPLPQNTPSSKAGADVRSRLVRCLAISPRLSDDAVKMVGGANIGLSTRQDLLALLEDVSPTAPSATLPVLITHSKVAEQQAPARKGDKSPRPWALKPQTWTEVRPFEWPKLTETERIAMSRQARMVFKALKIPESDPAWENVRYRPTAPTIPTSVPVPPPMTASNSNRSSASAQMETKRSAITTKDTKLKSKQDAPRQKGEIQMKDESTKATVSRVNAIKRAEAERPSTAPDGGTGAKTVASRRLPGSGYQAKKSPQPSLGVTEKSGTPVDARAAPKPSLPASLPQKPSPAVPPTGTHARKTIPTMPPKPVKKEDESDRERDREYERQREREREKREREKEKQRDEWERVEMEKREKARQKQREATEREKRQRENVREQEAEQEKRQRDKERIAKERATGDAVPVFKRKTATQDTGETLDDASSKAPLPKRRKLDDGTSVASSALKRRDAESSVPKKSPHEPSPAPRLKIKKELSPSQASVSKQERRATTSASGSTHKSERPSKMSGSAKPRRRSPIYTSSEDEGEIPQPRKRNPSPPPISDRSTSSDQPPTERTPRHHRTPRAVYPSPTDHAALRALYQSQYSNYLGAFSKVVAQKRKIEAMLNGDSEAEVDVMDPDDLVKLSMEHKSLKTELENIQDIYTKGTTTGAATGASGGAASD
ncbi:hypothetical protein J3R82DRAFT_10868 [Butyriboletus roseoflavus]|nr:hypothetical protein J3R82DRAFT_10868 [Butyriboletus roseoflavus]